LFDKLIENESKIENESSSNESSEIEEKYEIGNYELSSEVKQLRDELLRNELPNWAKESRDIEQVLPVQTLDLNKELNFKIGKEFKSLSDTSITAFIQVN